MDLLSKSRTVSAGECGVRVAVGVAVCGAEVRVSGVSQKRTRRARTQ